MKTAHHSTVTKAIHEKYGGSWADARAVYAAWKADAGRAPSLAMVRRTPPLAKPARWLEKAAQPPARRAAAPKTQAAPSPPPKRQQPRQQAPAREKPRRMTKRELTEAFQAHMAARKAAELHLLPGPGQQIRPGLSMAPAMPPPPQPAAPRKNQVGQNRFERKLAERGLPVELARGASGKEVVGLWRNEKLQQHLADELKRAHREIARDHRIGTGTRARLAVLAERILGKDANSDKLHNLVMQFVRQLYAKS